MFKVLGVLAIGLSTFSANSYGCDSLDTLVGSWVTDSADLAIHNPDSESTLPLTDFTFEINKVGNIYQISKCQAPLSDYGTYWCRTGKIEQRQNDLYAINEQGQTGVKIGSCYSPELNISFDNRKVTWCGAPAYVVLNWSTKMTQEGMELEHKSSLDSGVVIILKAKLRRSLNKFEPQRL